MECVGLYTQPKKISGKYRSAFRKCTVLSVAFVSLDTNTMVTCSAQREAPHVGGTERKSQVE